MSDIIITNKTYDDIKRVKFYKENGNLVTFYNTSDATGIVSSDLRKDKIVYTAEGQLIGDMPEPPHEDIYLNATQTEYTIPKGYHTGNEKARVEVGEITVTASVAEQIIIPEGNKLISKIIVRPAPSVPSELGSYIIGTPYEYTLLTTKWDGTTYATISLKDYIVGDYGLQLGLPVNATAPEAQAIIEAALTLQHPKVTQKEEEDGSITYTTSFKISAIKQPTQDLRIAIFGLQEAP